MRIIDADAFKEGWNDSVLGNTMRMVIDGQPTIDPESLPVVQQLRAAQDAAFRTRSSTVRAEVMRRLQKTGALALQPEVPRLEPPRVDRPEPSGNDFLADAEIRPRRHKRKG